MSNVAIHEMPEALRAELQDPAKAAEFKKGQELLQGIVQRSASDTTFRSQLLSTPRVAVAEYYREIHGDEGTVPSVDIHFIENRGDLTLVLPPFIDMSAELSDAELQTVAGGDTGATAVSVAAAVAASNLACLGFVAGVATVAVIVWAVN